VNNTTASMVRNPENGEAVRQPMQRTYDRTWEDIEHMLGEAVGTRDEWRQRYEVAKRHGNSRMMKDAARNYKALEGVEKTLRWVLGEQGISTPLH